MTSTVPPGTVPTTTGTSRWPLVAAGALTAAGALHLLAALDHLHHGVEFALFFLGVGAVQVTLGPGLRRGARPRTLAATAAASVGLILLYVYSRTVGLQFGPHADRPEDPDVLGMLVVACQLVAVAGLTAMLPPRRRPAAVNAVLAVGVGMWLLWLTLPL